MPSSLSTLATQLRNSLNILQKQDIQTVAQNLGLSVECHSDQILLGDDCAAIPDADGYLLLAAEGMWPLLVETEPWFAGWCAVMVNVSDIYAMGGKPIAIVDTLWSQSQSLSSEIWAGMQAAARAYKVPIVGGHTNCHSPYNALAVAILGRASHLITSFNAKPNDILLMAIDFQGKRHPKYPFWNAATETNPDKLRHILALLPELAAAGLCDAGKDISMGGLLGTTLMLLETSGCGVVLDLDAIPCPQDIPMEEWLCYFPSYGFLLSVRPHVVTAIQQRFQSQSLCCKPIGTVNATRQLVLQNHEDSVVFWDLAKQDITGYGLRSPRL